MKKRDFLVQALNRDEVIKKGQISAPWMISLLCLTKPVKEPIYPYGFFVLEGKGMGYLPTANNDLEAVVIDDYVPGKPLFEYDEDIVIKSGEVLNYQGNEDLQTTVGLLLVNTVCLCYPFGKKIPYINKRFSAGDIEKIVAKHMVDDPEDGVSFTDDPNKIYVSEYLRFTEGALWLTNFTQVCVPGVTERALKAPPGVDKRLQELLEEHKDGLNDPSRIVKIMDELIAMDKDYLKDDRSMGFLISPNKDFNIVRSRLFLTHGYGMNFSEKGEIDYIPQPLTEGTDLSRLNEYINISRAGSFSRADETKLGGVAVKELLRASNNLSMVEEDCGTTLGLDTLITDKNKSYYIGYTAVLNGKSVTLTEEILNSKVGTIITIRNPAYCKSPKQTFCRNCCGPILARHPTGLSASIAALGSAFMYLMMKAMHGKVSAVKKIDYKSLIS